MSSLLEQFIYEAREFLQGIGSKLLELEQDPASGELMTELFRMVHTLKGNSGLFDFPQMTRVLHAGEDLMDAVRSGEVTYAQELADRLLDAMDFVAMLIDEIEQNGTITGDYLAQATTLAQGLRGLIPAGKGDEVEGPSAHIERVELPLADLALIPENARIAAWQAAIGGQNLYRVTYRPEDDCFFKGEDPFYQARNTPGVLWGELIARTPWPSLQELDCYRCQLDFHLLVADSSGELQNYYRYTPEQVHIAPVSPLSLIIPQGDPNGGPIYGDFISEALDLLKARDWQGLESATQTLLELSAPGLWSASALRWLLLLLADRRDDTVTMARLIESLGTLQPPDWQQEPAVPAADTAESENTLATADAPPSSTDSQTVSIPLPADERLSRLPASQQDKLLALLAAQIKGLQCARGKPWVAGRLESMARVVQGCLKLVGVAADGVSDLLHTCQKMSSSEPFLVWLEQYYAELEILIEDLAEQQTAHNDLPSIDASLAVRSSEDKTGVSAVAPAATPEANVSAAAAPPVMPPSGSERNEAGRRSDEGGAGKVLKVEQGKIDRLMNLIGEMVVAKNSLPYLANRAENQYGVRELSRDIKAQYSVINRIAEEMQDAIMQVRMMPVSFIFQRFPRLVRDISRKLGKEVHLELIGEETEADKNIIEALADPLIHVVRNSLDHGLETPDVRRAAGKSATGRLTIRATQESDRVVIEIADDGRGIDPDVIKHKAYEKGIIDEARLERINDQDAINLVFAAGFSTAESVTDLSGRGVGMDVVRNAIDRVGGTIELRSQVGKGTILRLALPLSMAVTNVMVIESNRQIFGVPMDRVVETVRLARDRITSIKQQRTAVLRGRIVPLLVLNELLGLTAEPLANEDGEMAALVVRVGNEQVGLLVDEFREVVDVILKPLPGELAKLTSYAGSALLGDGTVLMVLNPKELV
jgi:two-component system, chemotaxis family, sensor kinase CheA